MRYYIQRLTIVYHCDLSSQWPAGHKDKFSPLYHAPVEHPGIPAEPLDAHSTRRNTVHFLKVFCLLGLMPGYYGDRFWNFSQHWLHSCNHSLFFAFHGQCEHYNVRLLWSECVLPTPQPPICIPKPQSYGVRRWGLWEVIRFWGWGPHGWDQCSYTRDPTALPCTVCPVRMQWEVCDLQEGPPPTNFCGLEAIQFVGFFYSSPNGLKQW